MSRRSMVFQAALLLALGGEFGLVSLPHDAVPKRAGTPTRLPDTTWKYKVVAVVRGPLGDSTFVNISAISGDSSGHLFIADGDGLHLADTTGRYLAHIARRGKGPGEVVWVVGLVGLPSGVWAVDYATQRYSRFGSGGRFLTSRPRSLSGRYIPWPGSVGPGGFIDFDHSAVATGASAVAVVTDTNWSVKNRLDLPPTTDIHVPFAPNLVLRSVADGVWFGFNARNRVYKASLEGDTILIVTLAREPQAVSDAERQEAIAAWQSRLRQTAAAAGQTLPSQALPIPSRKPVFQSLVPLTDGGVGVFPILGPPDRGRLVDLFDRTGRFRGTARLPYELVPGVAAVALGERLLVALQLPGGEEGVYILRLQR